ncbi:flavin reductase family protein [Parahaliea mediterranea]|uniref:Flavin reductase family protein n=1 Tax=Parahaliea mediterranea TaxID=651086 RepID=A0A939DI99_9GAMM|nr:flavin reductase family protein [Parahaliea mediterranea]MBN7798830.1 flavin reductase family protein [Parahaliea mediterranea]
MAIEGRELRNALGRFATGVCVITTTTEERAPIGMTVNSFAAVSLDPPLVLWSLQNNSEVYREYAAARYFNVNVLSSDQADHSNEYARKGEHLLRPEHFRQGRYGAPVIRDALVTFECELDATHAGGDHLIIVGRVKDMTHRPTGKPLLFYSGAYCELH